MFPNGGILNTEGDCSKIQSVSVKAVSQGAVIKSKRNKLLYQWIESSGDWYFYNHFLRKSCKKESLVLIDKKDSCKKVGYVRFFPSRLELKITA